MNKISIPVKKRRILGANKGDMWLFYPVLIWLVLTFIIFFVFLGTDNPVFLLCFFASFLSIIPIFIVGYKKSNKYRGENAVFVENVTFEAKDGELFAGDIKLPNISVDRKAHHINVNDVAEVKTQVKGISISSQKASFIGTIEDPYYDEFMKFLRENEINNFRK